MAGDLRLLQHEGELLEPFETEQIGSSAMAYKRNPMRAERISGLARFVISLQANGAHTAAAQWLERTLDDSANRRLTLPEAFLGTDAILVLATNIAAGLEVREDVIRRHVAEQMPFMATERWLMLGVAAGGDRQALHEVIRRHSLAVADAVSRGGAERPARAPRRRPGASPACPRPSSGPSSIPSSYTGRAGRAGRRVPGGVPRARCWRGRGPLGRRGGKRGGAGMTARPLAESRLPLPLLRRGKVREVYEVDADHLLLVASDRVSAFDIVMREPIPRKGAVLTQMSAFWFERLADVVPSHFVTARRRRDPRPAARPADAAAEIAGRAMLVRRTDPVPFECVVRGYLSGSAWAEYRELGHARGRAACPPGWWRARGWSRRSSRPPPRRSRATTSTSPSRPWPRALGRELDLPAPGRQLRGLPRRAATTPPTRGIIIADTKFEFGLDADGALLLIDEVMTPDSSRFWPADRYRPGQAQPSFDKQPLRDYLAGLRREGQLERRGAPAAAARRGGGRHQPPLSRGVPAHHRPRAGRRRRDPDGARRTLVHRGSLGHRARAADPRGCGPDRRLVGGRRPSGSRSRSGWSPSSATRSGHGPSASGMVVAPADGKVVSVVETDEPAFHGGRALRISIFMNVFDCHVNRYPVERHRRRTGITTPASSATRRRRSRASTTSSRRSVSTPRRGKVLIRQIAGLVARRIVTDHEVGATVRQGERLGMIRFGSRVDVFLPVGTRTLVAPATRRARE